MTKRKILMLAMSICMVAILAVGGTLAYFTDVDTADNVFTLGNVDIAIEEEFDPEGPLMPDEENKTDKIVNVTNTGSLPAYVRIHYAIPSVLVDQDINSYNDILHVNFSRASVAAGLWSWLPEYAEGKQGWENNGRDVNNVYNIEIDGVDHTVWVVTYTTALEAGATTAEPAFYAVYMDKYTEATDNGETLTYSKPVFTDSSRTEVVEGKVMEYTVAKEDVNEALVEMTLKVVAEGTQVDSFDDAYDALNTAFGVPGSYNPFN